MEKSTQSQAASPADATHLRKIRYRAWHRGTREMDLLLGPFADAELEKLDAAERQAFENLLERPDGDLQDWLMYDHEPIPPFNTPLIDRVRAFNAARARG